MFLAIMGFLMIFVIIYGLLQSKVHPVAIFAIVPIVAAIICGFDFVHISAFIKTGVAKTMPVAVLFIFSIEYFSIMSEVGLFDPMVKFLVKKAGSNVILVTVATGCIATVAHLDGALASTLLITIPAMLPIYKKLHMRPVVICVIIGAAMSIMNLMPWGGPVARVGVVLNTDVNQLWHVLIPLQIIGLCLVLAFAFFMGVVEKKRGAGLNPTGKAAELDEDTSFIKKTDSKEAESLKRPKLLWFNALLTAGVIGLLCFTKIQLYAAFMIGLAIALMVNFPDAKMQAQRIKAHADAALSVPMILLASGVFLGVLSGTKMMEAMAQVMITIIPNVLGPYLHLIMGFFAVPFGMMLGTDSYFFGLMPLAIGVGKQYGIDPMNMAHAMLVGKNFGVLVTPHAATTFLACGLAGIELKDLLKFCTPYLWVLSWISLIIAILLGIIII
ncbi:CitMHS family transporter [Pectinatus brassicae]|uniref:CitMHS family citrate-Mg2+:H+ or citrate-Ca2+:H+ symporter n=1 Tax=Pectinatus brassicae TaxID=862415 RepID=A0A840UUL1_9FIRM|nr:citrate:proton symporter [Pectinatus brassicae]MBB5336145.1 CitMHS family citrate-Mg2+:H+ or citrate-Ca2+:H+ symporter [Pectinatus brassicae]